MVRCPLAIPEEYFQQQLRVNRNTFKTILHILGLRLERQNTWFRDCIPPAKVLALGLYRLAHGNSYSTIGPVFNVGKSTVIEAVQDVVKGLYELRDEYVKFPETIAEVSSLIATFGDLTNLPNVVGVIDGSHIRIKAPNDSAPDYFSLYQQHDFIIQAIVDGKKVFMDFACGYPGSMHDARVLRRSTIFQSAEQKNVRTQPTVNVNGHDIGLYPLGDSAYPLSPWLMKPYPEGTRDPREIAFNEELSSARVKVECAFGVLKSRWRILLKRFDCRIPFAVRNAVASAVLHNICIRSGDEWDDEEEEDDFGPGDQAPNVIGDRDNLREILKDFL